MENIRKLVPEDREQKIDLYAYWKIFWRKKYYFLVPLVLSVVISTLGVGRVTPVYESFTLLAIEDKNILARTMGRYVTSVEERNEQRRNQQFRAMIDTRIKSRTFLEIVARDLGLDRSPELVRRIAGITNEQAAIPLEQRVLRYMVSTLKEKVSVHNPTPGFFVVSVRDTDPNTAYILVERVTEKFIDVTRQAQLQGIRQAGDFSDEQLAIYKEKLEASEKELTQVKRDMLGSNEVSNPVNSRNIHYAEAMKRTMDARLENSEIGIERVRKRAVATFGLVPTTEKISSDETVGNMEKQIIARGGERLLADLAGGDEDGGAEETLAMLREDLRQRIISIVNEEYSEFAVDLHPLIVEYFYQRHLLDYNRVLSRKLNSFIEQHSRNIERKPILEQELGRLDQEVETNRAIYQAFLESKTSAQITEAIQSTNLGLQISIIEKAEKPFVPVEPNKLKIILISLIFGAACGLGAVLVTEYADDSFRTVEEIQRILGKPVLGTIPRTATGFSWEKRKRGRMVLYWILGVVVFASLVSGAMYIYAAYLKGASLGIRLVETKDK